MADAVAEREKAEMATTAAASTQAAETWAAISKVMERPGILKDGVYVITVPRDDLEVQIEGMGVPIAAGIESTFYFYLCSCGKMSVVGQFVACDYESNDVVDALRQNALMKVPAIAPFLLYERPRLLLVRFQGEGDPVAMAGLIREALRLDRTNAWPPTRTRANPSPRKMRNDRMQQGCYRSSPHVFLRLMRRLNRSTLICNSSLLGTFTWPFSP